MVDNLVVAMMTAQANSMQVLADAPITQEQQDIFITNLSTLIALSLHMVQETHGLDDNQVMSLLTLSIMKAVEIVDVNS